MTHSRASDPTARPSPATPRPRLARAARYAYSTLTKQWFRATRPRDERHNERLWPHVTIGRDAAGRIARFSLGRRDIPLANADIAHQRQAGRADRTAHIIACGPSIRTIDYAALHLSHVIGVNGAVALDTHETNVSFAYYCITDTRFVRGRMDMVADIVGRDLVLFTTPLCLWHILQHFREDTIRCRFFLFERAGRPALQPTVPMERIASRPDDGLTVFDLSLGLGFSQEIRNGIFPGGTVAYEALQILNWLGYARIFLHGVDLGNAVNEPRFYETQHAAMPTTLHKQLATEIEPSFRQAARLLRKRGVSVRNLSPVSALGEDIFPKTDWRMLLG
ncbi:hypothetical protein OVY01_21160 [Robbsia sp. Bb-Pol-6]|uniref:Uncharacterized protein n=1 Tax=Robbsia betulipollinis TaxID=2981849 RepID=A0ABT3ZUU0_9BURK|nr:hypothetical protein [Robbsia betulipollinis]MCY0389660.1 hypothetical protein [Robbsia betulipollinis]